MYNIYTKLAILLFITLSANVMAGPGNGKSPGTDTIYDIASTNGNFTVLTNLLDTTGLDTVLDGKGQYTVFAPTDAAFTNLIAALVGAIGQEATDALLSDVDFLTNVLLYHVTDGRRFSNSVINKNNMKAIETLFEGHYIWSKPSLMIVDESSLTGDAAIVDGLFNINASNGVIHVIDAVLIPAE
jgi:transforming growth factor-beta-induced protein